MYKDFIISCNENFYYPVTNKSNLYNGEELISNTLESFGIELKNTQNINLFSFVCKNDIVKSFFVTNYTDAEIEIFDVSVYHNSILLPSNNEFYTIQGNLIYLNVSICANDIITIIFNSNKNYSKFQINKFNNNYNEKIKINDIINKFNNVVKIIEAGENNENI